MKTRKTQPPAELAAPSCSVTWADVLKALQQVKRMAPHLLATPVHLSCEPTDTDPGEVKRYQGEADTFTALHHGPEVVGLVMCYLGSPN